MRVLAFEDEAAPAGRLAAALGAPLALIAVHRFPDGEALPTVPPGAGPAVLYRSLDRPDGKIVPLLLAADAARRGGAGPLALACPYLCYLRQDALFAPGQPVSRDVVLPILGRAFDRVVTVEAHLHRTGDLSAVMGTAARNLSAAEPLAAALAGGERPLVAGPDGESRRWARRLADALGAGCLVFSKTRSGDREVFLAAPDLSAVKGRRVVLVDDVASSGTTLARAAERLAEAGAARVEAAVAHALFEPGAVERLSAAGISLIVSTDSVAHPINAAPLAHLLAEALK